MKKVALYPGRKLSSKRAVSIGHRIANRFGCPVEVNPTLVHHGLAKGANFHLTSGLDRPIADLYVASAPAAKAVAQLIANAIGEPVEVARNTVIGKGSIHASLGARSARSMPSRNPDEMGRPVVGETWTNQTTQVKCDVVSVNLTTNKLVYKEHGTGNRIYESVTAFMKTHRPARTMPRLNPKGRNPSRSRAARARRAAERVKGLKPRRVFRAMQAGALKKAGYYVGHSIKREMRRELSRNPKGRNPIPHSINRRSIRTVGCGGKRVLIGCPKGKYSPALKRCRVGTRAIEIPGRLTWKGPRKARARRNPRSPLEAAKVVHRMWQDRKVSQRIKRVKHPMHLPAAVASLGLLAGVIYDSNKYDGKKKRYEHRFKRPLPELTAGPDGRLHIIGGGYKTTADGLVN